LKNSRVAAAVAVLAVLVSAPAQEKQEDDTLRITVAKGNLRIALAVQTFADLGGGSQAKGAADEITEVVRGDLGMLGYFNLADKVVYDQIGTHDETAVPFKRYEDFGIEAVVVGNVRAQGDGIAAEVRLFDVRKRAMIFGKRLIGSAGQNRRVAHRIAGLILYHLTGEEGIFDSRIIFSSTRDLGAEANRRSEIWIMDFDGYGQRRVTYSDSLKLFPSFGPGESGIVYTSFINENPDVYRLLLSGGTAEKVIATQAVDMTPTISPDGTKIAFASSMNGNMDIYVSDINGNNPHRLTSHWAIDSSPCWSPDGRQIAFSSARTGTPQIYLMSSDGSNQRRITFEGDYNDGAAWSPDGTMIAYSARRPDSRTFDVRIHELATGQTYYVTRDVANDEDPTWSPDGRMLAFSSDREGDYQIYVIGIDGRGMRKLTQQGVNKHPSWSH
jgi:TolB protein